MFNEALCEIYDPRSIGELRKLAAIFESANKRVCVCEPAWFRDKYFLFLSALKD